MDVSIIIPCYNHGLYLKDALESIEKIKSNYKYEIIIINDGSTDEYTNSFISTIQQQSIVVVIQNNQGLAKSRNNGCSLAKGKYILPLDADNKILFPYLNEAIDILETEQAVDIVHGYGRVIESDNVFIGTQKFNLQAMLLENSIDNCAVFRKKVWEQLEGYDENMPVMGIEDWDFWIRAYMKGFNFKHLEKACFEYRVLNNSMIRSISNINKKKLNTYFNQKHSALVNPDLLNNRVVNSLTAFQLFKFLIKRVFFNIKIIKQFNVQIFS